MQKLFSILLRWLPSFFIMAVIFYFSSQPGDALPNFSNWDHVIKKFGHFAGYALLAFCNLHGLKYNKKQYWLAWLIAIVYSATDEFHQSFVPRRTPSILDVIIFDNLGAVFGLWFYFMALPFLKGKPFFTTKYTKVTKEKRM